jgi:hypothetical protein
VFAFSGAVETSLTGSLKVFALQNEAMLSRTLIPTKK